MGHATSLPADAIRFASRQALVINRVKGTNDNFLINACTVGVAVAESSNEYIFNAEALTVQITIAGVGVAVGDDVGPEVGRAVGDAVGPGVGTEVAEGKEVRNFNGKDYLLEYAFDADYAIVKAWKGDTMGNLIFKDTARNFNPLMAMAGKITIAEVEELVEPGVLDANEIHTPGIYVHRIFKGTNYEKRIEQRTVRKRT